MSLFHEFKKQVKNVFYIELSCRDDYGINDFWYKLGFKIVKAREGRATNELSVLHQFKYPLQKNFFDIIEEKDIRPKVLLDSSIVFSIDFISNNLTEKNALLSYSNDILFCIAPVIFEDMQKQNNDNIKLNSISKANKFHILSVSNPEFFDEYTKITYDFPQLSDSDKKQLTCAVSNNIKHFVTKDNQLLGLFKEFADKYNLLIQSPAKFYSFFDSILDREQRKDEILSTTHGKLIDIQLNEADLCSHFLNNTEGEKKYQFTDKFHKNIHNSELKLIVIDDRKHGIVFYSTEKDILTIHLIRFYKKTRFVYDISIFILGEIIQLALQNGITLINFSDNYAHSNTKLAVEHLGFLKNQKLSLRYIGNFDKFVPFVLHKYANKISSEIQAKLSALSFGTDVFSQIDLEHTYFPAKFFDIDIPSYIIPIRPSWAKVLLTPEIDGQYSLIHSEPNNILISHNNVYYSSRIARLPTPARLLWYVTKNKGDYIKSNFRYLGNIIAASYLDEVHIGSPKDIFKKFWKIGVYKWADINDSSGKLCTALIFSRTEIFPHKINYNVVKETIEKNMSKGVTLITVTPISNEVFFSLYKKGFDSGKHTYSHPHISETSIL